ncbi:MAG: hypothetical protein O8C61_12110 [Candidatus Methanoperedens sp.]|nr:hypothetical protein [Candidatus Methanoperedens sp.]
MNSRNLIKDDNAVSISIGYILMFAITVIVISVTIISFYSLTNSNEKAAMTATFRLIGAGLSNKITTVDTMVNITNSYGGTVNSLEYEFPMSASVADRSYTVNITNSPYQIILQSDNGAMTTSSFNISTNFTPIQIYSGAENYKISYNKSGSSLNLVEQ